MKKYKCENHKLDLACIGCIKAWIARHDRLLSFVRELTQIPPDRDDWREDLAIEAQELLKDIGKL